MSLVPYRTERLCKSEREPADSPFAYDTVQTSHRSRIMLSFDDRASEERIRLSGNPR